MLGFMLHGRDVGQHRGATNVVKAGVERYYTGLANELRDDNIAVNCLAPKKVVRTEGMAVAARDLDIPDDMFEADEAMRKAKRTGTPAPAARMENDELTPAGGGGGMNTALVGGSAAVMLMIAGGVVVVGIIIAALIFMM